MWDNVLSPLFVWIHTIFGPIIGTVFEGLESAIITAMTVSSDIIGTFSDVLSGLITFITGIFTADWRKAWTGIKDVFRTIVNGIIGLFESMINFVIRGMNTFLGGIGKVADAVGNIIGKDMTVSKISDVKLPRLAQGAVIPPNRAFMAVLGDQKSGTNIEAPLATIEEAVRNVLSEGNYGGGQPIIVELDGREIGRTVGRCIKQEDARTGRKLVRTSLVFG